jgi:DNA-directed RNA polymerase specialized sigma24 family protein
LEPEPTRPKTESKRDWTLTPGAFRRLLDWLDEGTDSGGQRYLEMQRRLTLYFDRKDCQSPDDLADDVLNRIARRLEEEGTITTDAPPHYCYIVARFVFLEYLRGPQIVGFEGRSVERPAVSPQDALEEVREKELRSECLERCVKRLEPQHRALIVDYYSGQQRAKIDNRRAMAARLGITPNALSIRACRIRERIEACVRKCIREG